MKKNIMQSRSQEMLLSTYEYTTLQLQDQLDSFHLRNVLDIEKDLSPDAMRNLKDIAQLCIDHKVNPSQKISEEEDEDYEGVDTSDIDFKALKNNSFYDRLEEQVKHALFESSYLNEKVMNRNYKIKEVLYPTLKKKQILKDVLTGLWTGMVKQSQNEQEY